MKLAIGDRVSFVNEIGYGIVISVMNDERWMVRDKNGFERPFKESELIKLNEVKSMEHIVHDDLITGYLDKELVNKKIKDQKLDFKAKIEQNSHAKQDKHVMEIDLHIHELLDDCSNMSNYEIVSFQMAHFERMIESAIKNKFRKVIFIHGVGQGVLKNEIRKVLAFYPNCTFHDAAYQKYGHGATEVVIRL
jgi:Smr domain